MLVLIVRLALATVFATSATTKLLDRPGTVRAIQGFGLPPSVAPAGAILLPVAELMTAALLLFHGTAWLGALLALVLLVVFSIGMGVNLARGRRPPCRCFGALSAEPIGPASLLRNVVLAMGALMVLAAGPSDVGPSVFAWVAADLEDPALALAATVVVLVGVVVVLGIGLLRSQARYADLAESVALLEELYDERSLAPVADAATLAATGLPIGSPAPSFSLTAASGATVGLGDLLAPGRPLLLVFVSPTCGPCRSLAPSIDRWAAAHQITVAVLSAGSPGTSHHQSPAMDHRVLWRDGSDVDHRYDAEWTPAAAVVGPDGRIASPVALGPDAISQLVEDTLAVPDGQPLVVQAPANPGLAVGESVPALRVGVPDGPFTDQDLQGHLTTLLFWRDGCPYCAAIAPDLVAWLADRGDGDASLVLVTPTIDDGAAVPGARLVPDPDRELAVLFGDPGTPTAVLVDAQGRVASPHVIGGPPVLALLGVDQHAGHAH